MNSIAWQMFKNGDSGKYCARTWSLCPYNFNIEKGTEQTMAFSKELKEVKVKEKVDKNCTEDCKEIEVTKTQVEDECYDYTEDVSL